MIRFKREVFHPSKYDTIHAVLMDAKNGIYKLVKPFSYTIFFDGAVVSFDIPEGFVTNFATIPKFLQPFIHPLTEGMLVSSCIHDFILNEFEKFQPYLTREYKVDGETRNVFKDFDWMRAADIFHAIMVQENGFDDKTRKLFTACVKLWYIIDPDVQHRYKF